MLLCGSSLSRGQQSEVGTKEVFWLNLPSSPLRIAVDSNGRHLELRNQSSGAVTGYQLGCVTEESGKIKVQRRFELLEMKNELAAGWFTVDDFKYRDLCKEKKAKLAVLRVGFSDGAEWNIIQ
jgi:hypothetical protein